MSCGLIFSLTINDFEIQLNQSFSFSRSVLGSVAKQNYFLEKDYIDGKTANKEKNW